jgi:hypothetical protein
MRMVWVSVASSVFRIRIRIMRCVCALDVWGKFRIPYPYPYHVILRFEVSSVFRIHIRIMLCLWFE